MTGNLSIIVAVADNMAIGRGGGIPWHIRADFRYFRSVTLGHAVLMGRGTWNSMGCKPLPGRRNIVVTTRNLSETDLKSGAEFYPSLEKALEAVKGEDEVFSIGGGAIYRQTIDIASKLYITHIHTVIEEADTFFPEIDPEIWAEASRGPLQHDDESGLDYQFAVYERK